MKKYPISLCLLLMAMACAASPGSGEPEPLPVSDSEQASDGEKEKLAEEIEIGQKNYLPTQQHQGGLYKADPALAEYVREIGHRLAAFSDRELPYEFVVLNNSTPNAWTLPGGKIAVSRGLLLALGNEAELAAVLSQEIAHATMRHGVKPMLANVFYPGVAAVAMAVAQSERHANHIVDGAQFGVHLIGQQHSRTDELEADHYGQQQMARAGYDPEAAATLQAKLLAKFLAKSLDKPLDKPATSPESGEAPWFDGLFSTHPPSEERLQRSRENAALIKSQAQDGDWELGAERYRQKLAHLAAMQDAYGMFDQAMTLAAAGETSAALSRVDEAISIEPREARFHGLKASLLLEAGKTRKAIKRYTRALKLDPEYYEHYLGRGLGHAKLGRHSRARADLEASYKLLPTAAAALELGHLALRAGERSNAKKYFLSAMSGAEPLKSEATSEFTRLDMADTPESFFLAQSFIRDGQFVTIITDQSGFGVKGIEVKFSANINGEQRDATATSGTLAGYGQVTLKPGWSVEETDTIEQVYVRVVSISI